MAGAREGTALSAKVYKKPKLLGFGFFMPGFLGLITQSQASELLIAASVPAGFSERVMGRPITR